MEKYEQLAIRTYLFVLGISIPIYFVLYGASGHKLNISLSEILWIAVAVIAIGLVWIFKVKKQKKEKMELWMFALLIPVLLLTVYAGGRVFWFMVLFDFDDEVVLPRILSYVVPIFFVISNLLILFRAIRYKKLR